MVSSYVHTWQKCALEVHDAEQRQLKAAAKANKAKIGLAGAAQTPELVSHLVHTAVILSRPLLILQKVANLTASDISSAAAPGKRSIGRGDVDLVIRSIKVSTRKTRKRPAADRPLSRIYMDGGSVTSRHRLIEP